MTTLVQSLPYREWIVGVGLDSDEKKNPPVKFKAVFERARREGYFLTMHCDVDQQNSTEHIRQCLEEISVNRIDHGVNVLDSKQLSDEVARRQLALTICPVSNAFVTNGSKAKEIKRMLELGIRATVHSDDPAYFRGYITENFVRTQEEADLGPKEVVQLSRNAFESTWLPRATKDRYLAELDAYAAR
jgi:adenosine deaminase